MVSFLLLSLLIAIRRCLTPKCCLLELLAGGAFVLQLFLAINLTTGVQVMTFSLCSVSPVLIPLQTKIFLLFVYFLCRFSASVFVLDVCQSVRVNHRNEQLVEFSLCLISLYPTFQSIQ